MKKKRLRMTVDFCMILLLPVLMAYSLVGETLHEVFGTAMFVLFIVHHVLNFRSTKAMFKGKYNLDRALNTILNIALFVIMLLLPLSGIAMSKHLFKFIKIKGIASTARTVHLATSYWGFVLMSVHLGTHLDMMIGGLKKKKALKICLACVFTAVSAYGVYAFAARDLWEYLSMNTMFVFFDGSQPLILFFADYLAIMCLFAELGYIIKKLLKRRKK